MSSPLATRRRTGKPDPTLLSLLVQSVDYRDVVLRLLDAESLSRFKVSRDTRKWSNEIRRMTAADHAAGVSVRWLRRLIEPEFSLVDGTIQLSAGLYALGVGESLVLETDGMRLRRARRAR